MKVNKIDSEDKDIIIERLYEKSLIGKEEFIEDYDKINVLFLERYYRTLFQKMYYSENKCNLEAFEYFITDKIDLSRHFTRCVVKHMIEDKEVIRNAYKAIIVECIKGHKKKLDLYESIRVKNNMKYFFRKIKEIESLDKIRKF